MSAGAFAWPLASLAALLAAALAVELRRRAELVARACHELRGPLTAAHLALHGAAVEAAGFELRRAGRALDDLAAARRGGRASDRTELVDLGELVRGQAASWHALARAAGVQLRLGPLPPAPPVEADPVRLAQALGNLVANAVEHGGGVVCMWLACGGGRVRVEVSDSGRGLPEPVAALVRRPRAGRGSRGRGLAIAAAIAERHGGRLAELPARRGARLALELPAAGR